MKWKEKEIKDLADQQLIDASFDLNKMIKNYEDKLSKRTNRHKNFKFEINPAYTQLKEEINNELDKRKLLL